MRMRYAVIDVLGEVLPMASRTLSDFGLKFVGSFNHKVGLSPDKLRLIVADEFGNLLPPECDNGWWLVRATFRQDRYGEQTLTKVDELILEGELVFGANCEAKIARRQAA